MANLRVFFLGGLLSYRALFSWMSPWIFIPSLVITPVFQILLFAYIGHAAGVGDNRFFLIGNAIQYASIPCLFAMGNTISGERRSSTLSLLLVTPARRIAIFGGRAVPTIANSAAVTVISMAIGAALLRVTIPLGALLPLLVVIVVAAASCTGLGLLLAAVALRVRETAVLPNVVYGVMLIFGGVNVALSSLPTWMQVIGNALPLTHAIEAARLVAAGRPFAGAVPLLVTEIGVGVTYAVLGFLLLRLLETASRRHATLELM
jgi:ABC-2 type transport system permease protein